ncbi:ATP-binding cassette sub-family C member 2 [Ixodes scapularis]|uniref:ATP-binding cassette sub-family C member 2 n=1 Tax=Ixodes scapularis TaxID=6945 RepID=UPI001A9F49D9|nr:ATP-binding cassette sub-family C member 2 [Ixodes scapularis]
MGLDTMMVAFGILQLPMPIVGTICLPLIFFMLSTRVGVGPTVSCATWLLFVLLLPFLTSKIQNAQWRKIMQARDERLKRMTDLLSSVRLVKMYAWEEAYMKAMKEVREKEMTSIFRVNLLDGLLDSIYGASTSVMTIILFGTLAAMDPKRILSPELSFSCVYMLSMTDMVTNSAPLTLRMLSLAVLSMRRIKDFCNAEEQENRQTCSNNLTRRKGAVALEKCSFAWTNGQGQKPKAVLSGISLDVKPGALVGITGFVGSGKSSLLAAILGDMHRLDGTVNINGKVAYVPQVACIYNMTVRDNIVFGQSFEPARYSSVLRACELFTDINTFPAGDLTEVGEKGETLSGGQKQRISLARAAYSRSHIYLLDDPLSALDPTVADKVFKQVLGSNGLLKDTTRILVSNQGNQLKHMSLLILMENNTLSVYHSLEELLQDERAPKTLSIGIAGQGQRRPAKSDSEAVLSEQDESNGKVTQLESSTSSKLRVQKK